MLVSVHPNTVLGCGQSNWTPNFYCLTGILLLKQLTAPIPTTAFLGSLHLHLLVDFVKRQDGSRGLRLRNSTYSWNCLLMFQNLDRQLSAPSLQNPGPASPCVWGMQKVPAVAGELRWSLTRTLPCCSPCMELACLPSPGCRQGPDIDPCTTFA